MLSCSLGNDILRIWIALTVAYVSYVSPDEKFDSVESESRADNSVAKSKMGELMEKHTLLSSSTAQSNNSQRYVHIHVCYVGKGKLDIESCVSIVSPTSLFMSKKLSNWHACLPAYPLVIVLKP